MKTVERKIGQAPIATHRDGPTSIADILGIIPRIGTPGAFNCCVCTKPSAYPCCAECQEERLAKEEADRIASSAREKRNAIRAIHDTLPARYLWANFDAAELSGRVKDKRAIAAAKRIVSTFSDEDGASIVTLTGAAGAGKTVLACCMFVHQIDRFWSSEWSMCFADAFSLERARRETRLGEETDLVARCFEAPLVVIDDLGAEPISNDRAIAEIIHARHANNEPTIVTTWMTPAQVAARYGDGIARRLFEGVVIQFSSTPNGGRPQLATAKAEA